MSRRKLSQEEHELWSRIAVQAERLHPRRQQEAVKPATKPAPLPATRIDLFEMGSKAARVPARHDLQHPLAERLSRAPVHMDHKAYGRMKRGKLAPEGRIDLHGMTLDRAHPALNRFILQAQASGKRLVLVITGKGRPGSDDGPIPMPRGILRHQVPHWLSMPPLGQAVLQVVPAHITHGGTGAYYVYLRKVR